MGYRGGSTPKPRQSILKDLLILKTIRLFKKLTIGRFNLVGWHS